jgi:hypothetical protein
MIAICVDLFILVLNFLIKVIQLYRVLPAYIFFIFVFRTFSVLETASVVWWSEFLATDPEVPGLIPGATRFSEK